MTTLNQVDACYTCEFNARREAGQAPLWDNIYGGLFWYVAHALNVALPGYLIVISKRHIAAIDEMSDAEAAELGILLRRVSLALREAVGCEKTYVAQFAEAAGYHHVHFHVIPRMADQPAEYRGPNVFKYLNVPEHERVSEDRMNAIAESVRYSLTHDA